MPARAKSRGPRQTTKCKCGCGQGAAGRSRKVTCANRHYSAFVARSTIEAGIGTCWCGEPLEPTCMNDRCYLPGAAGEAAMEACSGMDRGPAPIVRLPGPGADERARCRFCGKLHGCGSRRKPGTCPHCGCSPEAGYSMMHGESLREAMPF